MSLSITALVFCATTAIASAAMDNMVCSAVMFLIALATLLSIFNDLDGGGRPA